MVDGLWREIRHAARSLRRAPAFTVAAVVTLALGIGASTAMFAVVDRVLLRPLPFPQPDRLTMIQPTSGSRISAAYLEEWRRQSRTIGAMAGWYDVRMNLTGSGEAVEVHVDRTTSNFFRVLGLPALIGRTFHTTTDLAHVEQEAVLSYAFWQQRYGSEPAVIGRRLTLDGQTYTVVGVMPPQFAVRTTELAESRADLWTPFALVPGSRFGMGGSLNVIARLRPAITVEQARADLNAIHQRLEEQFPSYSQNWSVTVLALLDATVKDIRATLLLLFAGVGVLLLIAGVNVANLVLLRSVRRDRQWATRLALGATRRQIARPLLMEALLLAALAGIIAIAIGAWVTKALIASVPPGVQLPRTRTIAVDGRVLLFPVLIAMAIAAVCGFVSVLGAIGSRSRVGIAHTARDAVRMAGWSRFARALIVSEVALSLLLAAGAVLLVRSVWSLTRVDSGFRSAHVVTMRTTLPADRYDNDDRVRAFGDALLNRIQALPGIEAAGLTSYLPMTGVGVAEQFEIEGRPAARIEDQKFSWTTIVGGRYFDAMGIPVVRGRVPDAEDSTAATALVVIDETLTRRYWGDADPVGARITSQVNGKALSADVIGVVGNVRWQTTSQPPPAMIYWWFPSVPTRDLTIIVRASGEAAAVAASLASQLKTIDPNQPVADIRTMDAVVTADLARPRFTMLLLAAFATAALLLMAVGLYGLISFAVNQRTPEFGIRLSLGAAPGDLVRMVIGDGLRIAVAGVLVGMVSAVAMGRVIQSLLFGVTPSDPSTYVAVIAFLLVIASIAAVLPARRAARVDPVVALRAE